MLFGRRGDGAPLAARTPLAVALLAASATFSVFLIAVLIAGWSIFYAPGPSARAGDQTVVTLPSGAGVSAIAQQLKQAGVIRSTDMFKAAVTLTGADRRLRAGEYEVPSGASLRTVVSLLVSGRVVRHFVTLPEGWSSAQAVDILMKNPILTGEVEVPPEGSLWPETYEVTRGESRAAVIRRMRLAHDRNLAELWAQRGPSTVVSTPEEAVILASIVEKETAVAAERPRVAAVFSNRLRIGMRLESDPTIVYGITQGRPLGRGLRRSEIDATTRWNTYRIDGLPPTPIANPGREAIRAVLNPPVTQDLFFVADGTGGHAFAATYDQHLANVARWREIERRRAGLPPEPVAPVVVDPAGAAPTGEMAPDAGAEVTVLAPGAAPR
ncbi:endolytic transglycosylase MltG [Brevundimonas sp.]|uniref:endolytic transglycosylase MltG n=1 Tax=Brevundimonas sp. TaxID=1871086 RepID=UPI002630BE15|nr:endolytic transglycosylase MltG [Brevundimonas sp.]